MPTLQMIHYIVMCQPHLFLKYRLDYPWLSTHVNAYSTPSIDEPPVPKDWPGALRVDRASLVGQEDVVENGVDNGPRVHGGGWSLRVGVTGWSQV
jgi:hypothetical protein